MTVQRPKTTRAFLEATRLLASPGSVSSKLASIADFAAEAIQADWVSLVIIDWDLHEFNEFLSSGAVSTPEFSSQSFFSSAASETAILSHIPSEIGIFDSVTRFHRLYPSVQKKSGHFVGLSEWIEMEGRIFGVMSAVRAEVHGPMDDEDWHMLGSLALLVSQAFHVELLVKLEQAHSEQAATLREVARNLNSSLDLQTVLELILDQLGHVVEYDSASVMLVKGPELHIVANRKFRSSKQLNVQGLAHEYAHIYEVLEKQTPVIINDTHQDPRWRNLDGSGYIRCWLGVPLVGKERTIGLLNLDKEQPNKYSQEDAALATAFANQAAIAIENARLFQAEREASDRHAILHRISQQIVAINLEEEGVYQAIHRAAAELMPVEAFVITEYDESSQKYRDSYLIDKNGRISSASFEKEDSLSGKVIRTGLPLFIPDLLKDKDQHHYIHFGEDAHVRSIVAVPMQLRGKVIGMISAQSYSPEAYSFEDLTMLEMLASYAAVALDNAHLFEHIQQLATTDPVTNLFNRRHFFNLGRLEFVRAARFKRRLSVIMLDVDHFKMVNDRFGHGTGDQVLLNLAQLIRSELREVDIVGRYGGEEFTVILPETDLSAAVGIARRLSQKIKKAFQASDSAFPRITVSMGIADNSFAVDGFPALVQLADDAMYQAKRRGRDRIVAYTQPEPSAPG